MGQISRAPNGPIDNLCPHSQPSIIRPTDLCSLSARALYFGSQNTMALRTFGTERVGAR